MTYSLRHISKIAGAPKVTTTVLCLRDRDISCSAKWQCGCRSTGPLEAMTWMPCATHEIGVALIDDELLMNVVNRIREQQT